MKKIILVLVLIVLLPQLIGMIGYFEHVQNGGAKTFSLYVAYCILIPLIALFEIAGWVYLIVSGVKKRPSVFFTTKMKKVGSYSLGICKFKRNPGKEAAAKDIDLI